MMSRYVQIIPALPGAVAHCYFIDEDGKRKHNGEYWQAPIVCYGMTDRLSWMSKEEYSPHILYP